MDLIVLNGYTPPAPSKYDVGFSDINGTDEQLESGEKYKEQTRSQVPTVTLGWTNITEEQATAILAAVAPALFDIKYFFGSLKNARVECTSPKIILKFCKDDERYYDLSMVLEG